ncbi:DUF2779 domain-containing protein [Brevifollis gellanilyticus]|uniref:DUF2779 domain-containing protein n=1 Tax=Brevifollis gellanilyticus TaxID=748831 RepID=A0A512M2C7_9BACT|nr:DUF2779 domain-containing protein [Brevifollis gellanilyticus]GEP40894.1 hypothetical protein BGE01nite_01850 [Brevifollis gellanilyticus]
MYLTKSDFKVASACPTKLYYRKLQYPSLLDADPFLEFLADGGYMIEKMAKLLYPEGIEMGQSTGHESAFKDTTDRLQEADIVLFEPTVLAGNLLARIDILVKKANHVKIIEVKSSSVDAIEGGPNPFRGSKGGILAKWRPYLEDVTFQALVFNRAFPQLTVEPMLCIVDKSAAANEACTLDKFNLRKGSGRRMAADVEYSGDLAALKDAHVLAFYNVAGEVGELTTEVEAAADGLAATLRGEVPTRSTPTINMGCKKCEYRTDPNSGPSGFTDCWGSLAKVQPHLFDFVRLDGLRPPGKNDPVSLLTGQGTASLLDIPEAWLSGAYAPRQRIQLTHTSPPREYLDESLRAKLRTHDYPLHFIDFEASRVALPYHTGMHPYQQVAFQWSCHTIRQPGAPVEHSEWINLERRFPNFGFAKTLHNVLGNEGTIYVWSHFEMTALKEIRSHMTTLCFEDPALATWLEVITDPDNPRVIDMEKLAAKHYFHPRMGGRTSIKVVLPAVWENDPTLWRDPFFSRYYKVDADGKVLDPYKTLTPLPVSDVGEDLGVVIEGTAAIRAYQDLVFGRGSIDERAREGLKKLLLQYCELDTAAMVMIWKHWIRDN